MYVFGKHAKRRQEKKRRSFFLTPAQKKRRPNYKRPRLQAQQWLRQEHRNTTKNPPDLNLEKHQNGFAFFLLVVALLLFRFLPLFVRLLDLFWLLLYTFRCWGCLSLVLLHHFLWSSFLLPSLTK